MDGIIIKKYLKDFYSNEDDIFIKINEDLTSYIFKRVTSNKIEFHLVERGFFLSNNEECWVVGNSIVYDSYKDVVKMKIRMALGIYSWSSHWPAIKQ